MIRNVNSLFFIVLFAAILIGGCKETADIRLHPLFSDNMVLQRDTLVKIWGYAGSFDEIKVEIAGQFQQTKADSSGAWHVVLEPMTAGGPFDLVVWGDKEVVFKNVLIGDVWLCSGQSNMTCSMTYFEKHEAIKKSDNPTIRLFTVPQNMDFRPVNTMKYAVWYECTPAHVTNYSATAYFFGYNLQKELNVPIGLICSSGEVTMIESWMSGRVLAQRKEYATVLKQQRELDYDSISRMKTIASQDTTRLISDEDSSVFAFDLNKYPTTLYNAMIHPLKDLSIKGVVWYQGESNVSQAYRYRKLFPLMIKDWRHTFKQEELPFIFVQLAGFYKPDSLPSESRWAELREAQEMALLLPKTGMAIAYDIGDTEDIHPANKEGVGFRLSRSALKIAYNKDVVYAGPEFVSMDVEGNQIRLFFDHIGSGLTTFENTNQLGGFAISGLDQKYKWGQAYIDGNTVVLYNDEIKHPVTVRFAWGDYPDKANLYNKEGLPASPFRTDEWPGLTIEGRR